MLDMDPDKCRRRYVSVCAGADEPGGPSDMGRYRQIDDIRTKRNIRHAIVYSPVTIALAYKLMNTLL